MNSGSCTDGANRGIDHIVFFGHHKCASRSFRRAFAALGEKLDIPVFQYQIKNPPFRYDILHDLDLHNLDIAAAAAFPISIVLVANAGKPVVDEVRRCIPRHRAVRIIRDPRQLLVSNYFDHIARHKIESPVGWIWDRLAVDRPVLERLELEDGLLYELDHTTRDLFENQMFAFVPDDRVLVVKLEDWRVDPSWHLQVMAEHLGVDQWPALDWNGLHDWSRGATSRSWQDVLTPRVLRVLKDRYGDQVRALGYDW